MATADWPQADLGSPLVSGYSYQDVDRFLRSEVEGGPARHRQRFTQVPTRFKFSLDLEDTQLLTFQGWWLNGISDGVDWFNMELGVGWMTEHEVRFLSFPEISRTDEGWIVQAEIEARQRDPIDAATLEMLQAYHSDLQTFRDLFEIIHEVVHVDTQQPLRV